VIGPALPSIPHSPPRRPVPPRSTRHLASPSPVIYLTLPLLRALSAAEMYMCYIQFDPFAT
jgi:hypothetical protein